MIEPIDEFHEHEDEIVAAYRGGHDAERLGRRFGLTAAEVERIVDRLLPPARGLQACGNRVLLAIGVGYLVGFSLNLLAATERPARSGVRR